MKKIIFLLRQGHNRKQKCSRLLRVPETHSRVGWILCLDPALSELSPISTSEQFLTDHLIGRASDRVFVSWFVLSYCFMRLSDHGAQARLKLSSPVSASQMFRLQACLPHTPATPRDVVFVCFSPIALKYHQYTGQGTRHRCSLCMRWQTSNPEFNTRQVSNKQFYHLVTPKNLFNSITTDNFITSEIRK